MFWKTHGPQSITRCLPAAILAAGILLPAVRAADDTLPKAEEILDRYIEVTGGKQAYEKIKSRRITGTFSVPAQELEANLVLVQKAPNMRRLEISMESMGKSLQVCDGENAWEVNELMNASRLLEGEEKQMALRLALFHADLHWRKLYDSVETVGVEEVDGRPAYKVVLESKVGDGLTNYYDKENGRMVRSDRTIESPMGTITIQSYPGDYKQVDGIWLATTGRQIVPEMDMERKFKIEKVEHNIDISADMFEPPAEIKKQLEKPKEPEPKPESPDDSKKPATQPEQDDQP